MEIFFFRARTEIKQNFFQWNESKTNTKNLSFQHHGSLPSGALCGVKERVVWKGHLWARSEGQSENLAVVQ